MFDTNIYRRGAESVNVTVNENRAPTDQSVALLKEMEQAARDKVLQSVRLENCPVDCVIHHHESPLSDDVLFAAILKINGKRIEVRESFRRLSTTPEQFAIGLRDAIAKEIAGTILSQTLSNSMRDLRF